MRLLERGENGDFSLTEDLVGENIPKYAILSHTWGSEEVTFKDMADGTGKGKAGYNKIRFCAERAGRDSLQYFWVDTCCIDKSTSDELQASINSMFRWYRDATRCYVYLSDVSMPDLPQGSDQPELSWEPAYRASRWFTRGWTLQELLAPASVEFFTREGARLGDKRSLEQQIHKITGIPVPALQGTPLSQFGVDERLAWAETRQTSRPEDWAYCLLGIFGVFIPLIYGEGRNNAIRRLRKEIQGATPQPFAAIPAQIERQQPVLFEDAHGRIAPFHTEFINSFEAFQAVLEVRFHFVPGLKKVQNYEYVIQDSTLKKLNFRMPWESVLRPGMRVSMSMVFHKPPMAMSLCPGCQTENETEETDASAGVQCSNPDCKLWYQRIVDLVATQTVPARRRVTRPRKRKWLATCTTEKPIGTGEDEEEEDEIYQFRRVHVLHELEDVPPPLPPPKFPIEILVGMKDEGYAHISTLHAERDEGYSSLSTAKGRYSTNRINGTYPKTPFPVTFGAVHHQFQPKHERLRLFQEQTRFPSISRLELATTQRRAGAPSFEPSLETPAMSFPFLNSSSTQKLSSSKVPI